MDGINSYWYSDGAKGIGPHSPNEISEMFNSGLLKPESLIWTPSEAGWKALKEFPSLMQKQVEAKRIATDVVEGPSDQQIKRDGVRIAQEDDGDEDEEDGEERFTPVRSIRATLDDLWEAQRESIIAKIKNEELDEKYEKKRKEHTEIKAKVKDLVLEYWRRGKVLDAWIRDLIWEGNGERGDYRKKLIVGNVAKNFEIAENWLENIGVSELAGCYGFREGKKYIYIGKADNLGKRIKQHEGHYRWAKATHLRIFIPQHKASTLRLERLLILKHQPEENKNDGISTEGSRADEVLELIDREINELLTDG
jgi:predicted GIY-YIG superfamily endonuclease